MASLWRLLLLAGAASLTPPDGCSPSDWTALCMGSVTCESLAIAQLTCDTLAVIPACSAACAEPCCITTTTTTMTSITATSTATTTETQTDTSVTVTVTSATTTDTMVTQTHTGTTHTLTSTRTTSISSTFTTWTTTAREAFATTEVPSTAPPTEYAGPFERLTVRVRVTDVHDDLEYIIDSRVSTAYREVIMGVTGLQADLIDLQMVPQTSGNITVTYILSIPEDGGEKISMTAVKDSLHKETAASFTARLVQEINEHVGAGVYTQKVIAMQLEEDHDTGIGVSGATRTLSFFYVIGACLSLWQ